MSEYVARYLTAYRDLMVEKREQPGGGETFKRAGLLWLTDDQIHAVERAVSAGRKVIDCEISGICYDEHGALIPRVSRSRVTGKVVIPDDLRWKVWERDDFTCRHCGSRRFLSVDHIHPESKGGTLALDNLQTLCRSCNSRKGAN